MQKWDEGAWRREGNRRKHTLSLSLSHTHILSLSDTHTHTHTVTVTLTVSHSHGHTLTVTQVCEGQEGEHRQEAFAPSQCAVKRVRRVSGKHNAWHVRQTSVWQSQNLCGGLYIDIQ